MLSLRTIYYRADVRTLHDTSFTKASNVCETSYAAFQHDKCVWSENSIFKKVTFHLIVNNYVAAKDPGRRRDVAAVILLPYLMKHIWIYSRS